MTAAPFRAPRDKTEQRAIAHVLGTLDDKIELNRRMNETLEAMARALFKDWFVDFGPVRAKMAGRAPYLPPGRLVSLPRPPRAFGARRHPGGVAGRDGRRRCGADPRLGESATVARRPL